jgi:hypothetical protein
MEGEGIVSDATRSKNVKSAVKYALTAFRCGWSPAYQICKSCEFSSSLVGTQDNLGNVQRN